jgi:hypothetical protein
MTADLAISGTPTDTFVNGACSITLADSEYVASWMLTFPVETVYVTNVQKQYMGASLGAAKTINTHYCK